MTQTAREEILGKLKAAPKQSAPSRPGVPPPAELSWTREQMIEEFTENLRRETAIVHRVENYDKAAGKLTEIAKSENLKKVIVSTDDVVAGMNLQEWGTGNGIEVLTHKQFTERAAFKKAVFVDVEAGITGVDYAVAESGTLCLIHDENHPRLLSLAPATHIAIVPAERLFPAYENVTDIIFQEKRRLPSHVTFTTGPSMTADIMGVPFKGMHGPKKLIVIIIGG
ncbi:lactate utilization protein [Candidatus Poribacteria bacterium]|nr:lactate utilization protein [Candidatus Poribacteria bacterium]